MKNCQEDIEELPAEYDKTYYDDCLRRDESRLFKNGGSSEIELLYITQLSRDTQISKSNQIHINEVDVDIPSPAVSVGINHVWKSCAYYIKLPEEHIQSLFYIIRQENTWGRLLVTSKVFNTILTETKAFAPYIAYLQAFGRRDTDEQRSRSASYWQKAQYCGIDEFCYNVKYIARNDRPQRNPWSIRQTGVYERRNLHTGESVWIILQPSERAHRRLKEATGSPHFSGGKASASCIALHVAILIASGREWGEYLEELRGQMQQLDLAATYSSVGKSRKTDFSVTFNERQKVQLCRTKLLKALHALDMDIAIVDACEARYRYFVKIQVMKNSHAILQDLECHSAELRAHRTATTRIMSYCTWIADLQEKILEYRNDETMRDHSQALRDIASAQRSEGEIMTRLTRQTAQDSKMLKALTVMASLYLPPTLLATIFSSNLVQLKANSTATADGENTHFVIASDFWIYVVVMLPLTVSTALLVMWMRRRAARRI